MSIKKPLVNQCASILDIEWKSIFQSAEAGHLTPYLGEEHLSLRTDIRACLKSATKSYHYVLPTQILAKMADHSLDCRSLQAAYDSPGAFDARTIAHQVIVPFDKANHSVLGGSPEPYVNNPLRRPAVTAAFRDQQKNQADWDRLANILATLESANDPSFTQQVFRHILAEMYEMLADVIVVYPTPNRISLDHSLSLIQQFAAARSGGDRIEALVTALFMQIRDSFGIFDEIRRERVNAADASSGMVADVECKLQGKTALLIEVKDTFLTFTQLDAKLDAARAARISEILFMAQGGIDDRAKDQIDSRISQEFTSGQNVYVTTFEAFAIPIMIILGEKGRGEFIRKVGSELDRVASSIVHRKAWAALLKQF